MLKYIPLAAVVFLTACNSNEDQKATTPPAPAPQTSPFSAEDTTTGTGLLSGNFEIVEYKKDNVKVDLPKTIVRFTRSGEFMKPDGNTFSYKIEGDSLSILLFPNDKEYITKSAIQFLNEDKSAFKLINPKEHTEYTYQKVKQ